MEGAQVFLGGDILTGSLTVDHCRAIFSNYSASLSFPGGTTIHGTAGVVTYDVSRAPSGASVRFGTGSVTLFDSGFESHCQNQPGGQPRE